MAGRPATPSNMKPRFKTPSRHPYASLPILIAAVTVFILGVSVTALHYIETRLIAAKGETLALAAADIADKLDVLLFERYADIQVLTRNLILQGPDQKAKSRFLSMFKTVYPMYVWLAVTDPHGRIVAATNPESIGKDQSASDWFQIARARGGVQVQDAQVTDESSGSWAVAFTAPLMDSQQRFRGVVTTRVGLPALEDIFGRTLREFQTKPRVPGAIEYEFLTRDGDVITDSRPGQGPRPNLKYLGVPSALLTGSARPGYIEEKHVRRPISVVTGYAQTEGFRDFPGLHWGVLVRMDRSAILTPIRNVLGTLALSGALIILPVLGFLFWATGRLRSEYAQVQEEGARAKTAESALQLRDRAIAASSSGIFIADAYQPGTPIVFVNPAFERLTGYTAKDVLGYSYRFLQGPDTDPAAFAEIRRALQEHRETRVLLQNTRPDCNPCWNDLLIAPIWNDQGKVTHFVGVLTDVTDRQQAEKVLQENAEKLKLYREIYALSNDAIAVIDPLGRYIEQNEAHRKLLGYSDEELQGKTPAVYIGEEAFSRISRELSETGKSRGEFVSRTNSGEEIILDLSAFTMLNEAGKAVCHIGIKRDITERKRAEEIRVRLLQQVISAQEEERGRIARELHDETGQSLTAILIGLRTVESAPTLEDARIWAESLRTIASMTLQEVGRLAWGLRPSVLDDLGLVATLERYTSEYSDSYEIAVEMETKGLDSKRLPFTVETTLYRIVQEALTNIAKHASAKNVKIFIERQPAAVRMSLKDDGRGFDVTETLRTRGSTKHLGLHGMQERAALLNGSLAIESIPNKGTSIYVQIPLTEDSDG
jgi:PAS domain S-box-containing protein